MIANLTIILIFQLIGEGVARTTGAPAPGPIIGMVLLFLVLLAAPSLAERLRPTANGLLSHLALLFVPAGVGVIGHLGAFASFGAEIALILIVSTLGAVAAGAGAFILVQRITGGDE